MADTNYAPVTAHEGALVGDEAVQGAALDPVVETTDNKSDAQVVADPVPAPAQVVAPEVNVQTDHVILDPSSPLAVQVPDAGRGEVTLPISALEGPTVEDVFAADAKPAAKSSSKPASSDKTAS